MLLLLLSPTWRQYLSNKLHAAFKETAQSAAEVQSLQQVS
jgi:hypothetical protein